MTEDNNGFYNVRFLAVGKRDEELSEIGARSWASGGVERTHSTDNSVRSFNSDEAAARFYLKNVLQHDSRDVVRGLTSQDSAELIPDIHFLEVHDSPLTKTKLVKFEQTHSSVPVFGSQAVVELDQNRELVSLDAELAEIRAVSPVASLSPAEALSQIAQRVGIHVETLGKTEAPELTYYHKDQDNSWHLAYFFKNIPAAPQDFITSALQHGSRGHGPGPSPRDANPLINYLVDAHNGELLLMYSAIPMIALPSKCQGMDENNEMQSFWGSQNGSGFEMLDPARAIETYDLRFQDFETVPIPKQTVQSTTSDWNNTNKAAVSAHVNAMRVYDFYNNILFRNGIDDKGMTLISVINCTYPRKQTPPNWHNAVFYMDKMWYGQRRDTTTGTFTSYSKNLDVIAHELTHGVTEFTSGLIYLNESGALNESFSDIFGIIIKNWYLVGPNSSVKGWNWEMGTGLTSNGEPLRDMSNPSRTNDPSHMRDYLHTSDDHGGVHTNSNIHNKAAHNVLTARDSQGQHVFPPAEIAVLYYLCLERLNSTATFSKTKQVLVDVAKIFYAGAPDMNQKVGLIIQAYDAVGIS